MKTDIYTKVILTIIAICLIYNVVKDMELISSAYAVPAPDIVEYNKPMDVNIVSVGSFVSLPVRVEAWNAGKINTNVESWRGSTVPVKVEDWRAGTLDVRTR